MANGITLGTLTAEATMQGISVELTYTGDDNDSATAMLEFRATGDPTWRKSVNAGEMWRVAKTAAGAEIADGVGRGFYAKAGYLLPNTSYDIRVTVADADGVTGTNPITTTCTTRADNITAPGSITAATTLYVDSVSGNDTTGTGAIGAPYKTQAKAVAVANATAGTGTILILLKIHGEATTYYLPGGTLTRANTTIKAENIATGTDIRHTPANDGARVVIEPGPTTTGSPVPYVVGPTGAADTDLTTKGGWTETTIAGHDGTGTPTGRSYKVWQSPVLAVTEHRQVFYGATRAELPTRSPWWKKTASAAMPTDTLNKWVESMFTISQTLDQGFQYGCWSDTAASRLYVRLYDPARPTAADANDATNSGLNPNGYYVKYSPTGIQGITLNGADQRLCGVEIHGVYASVVLGPLSVRSIIDRCYSLAGWYSIRSTGTGGLPSSYGSDAVIQQNRFVNTSLWDLSRHRGVANWGWIKQNSKWGAENECFAIAFSSGPRRAIVRNNYCSGDFDFFNCNPTSLTNFDRYANYGTDVLDNYVEGLSDDFADMGKQVINCWFSGNFSTQTATFLSTGPTFCGPIYFVRNVGWWLSSEGVGLPPNGAIIGPSNGKLFKYSQNSDPLARIYIVHNTGWGDSQYQTGVTGGGEMTAGGAANPEAYWLRNNIFRGNRHAYHVAKAGHFASEDYNWFQTTQKDATSRGIDYPVSGSPFLTIAAYRTASGKGAHSNKTGDGVDFDIRDRVGPLVIDLALTDPANGNLLLPNGSTAIGAGVVVDNISDVLYTSGPIKAYHYSGAAPDIGYAEYGLVTVAGSAPTAPSGFSATVFSASRIDLACTDNSTDELGFRWERAPDVAGSPGAYAEIAATGVNVTTYADTGLAASTRFWYRVRAYNAAGNSAYATADDATTLAATPTPTAPSGLTALALSSASIRVVWVDNSNNEQGFYVERSPAGAATWVQIADVAAGTTTLTSTGLASSTAYDYRVRAYNAAGNSSYTSTASATTPAPSGSAIGTSEVGRATATGRFSAAGRSSRAA